MSDLISRLQAAKEGSGELDAEIYLACEVQISKAKQAEWDAPIPLPKYALLSVDWHGFQFTRNLAAAKRIIPQHEKGGWYWRVGSGAQDAGWAHLNKFHLSHCDTADEVHAVATTPELALCIAALRARSVQQ